MSVFLVLMTLLCMLCGCGKVDDISVTVVERGETPVVLTAEPIVTEAPVRTEAPTPSPTPEPTPVPAEPYYIEAKIENGVLAVEVKPIKTNMLNKVLYVSFYEGKRLVKTTIISKKRPTLSETVEIPAGVDNYSCVAWYDSGEYMARAVKGTL